MIRAVLSDWGHTLFGTAGSVTFLEEWAATRGIEVPPGRVKALYDDAFSCSRTAVELAQGRDLSAARHRECWLALWSDLDALLPGVATDLYAFETSAAGWHPYPDTPSFMKALAAAGIPLVIVSDVPFDLRAIVAHYGLAEYVNAYFLSGEHGTVKAEGRLFALALEHLGLRADEVLMVGDNPSNDGYAALFGIRTLLLPLSPPGAARGLDDVLRLL